jgi:hypothetical protein
MLWEYLVLNFDLSARELVGYLGADLGTYTGSKNASFGMGRNCFHY